jgi:hypothetical protein
MKVLPLIVVLLLTAEAAAAQSLGDVAQREAERRKAIAAPGKVFTNDNLRVEPPPTPTSVPTPVVAAPSPSGQPAATQVPPSPSGTQPPAAGQPAAPGAAAPAEPQTEQAGTEASWRERITAAREALTRARTFAEALQTRINVLSADFVNRDDPAQRSVVAADRQKAMAELDRVKQEIAQQEKAIVTIQDEARRAGVPAGWVR